MLDSVRHRDDNLGCHCSGSKQHRTRTLDLVRWSCVFYVSQAQLLQIDQFYFTQLVIFCLGLIISPLAWITYESYAYRRELQTAPVDTEDAEGGSFSRRRQAKTDAMATQMQLQPTPTMVAELSKPFGRRRRGREGHNYERADSSSESDYPSTRRQRRASTRS